MKDNRTHLTLSLALALMFVAFNALDARAQAKQPNIVIIWNNDISYRNISPNNHNMFGSQDAEYRTQREGRQRLHRIQQPPELPREARSVHQRQRSDLPRHDEGRRARREERLAEDRRGQATDCKNRDYATGQVGKNHSGETQ
jgi:hypothetical protein